MAHPAYPGHVRGRCFTQTVARAGGGAGGPVDAGASSARSRLATVASVLHDLGCEPSPDDVAGALVRSLADEVGARAAMLVLLEGEALRLIGCHGYADEERAAFDLLPLAADLPICEAVREGVPLVSSLGASVPIIVQGRAVGGYGFACGADRAWTSLDLALLSTLAHALGLWLAHPSSGLVATAGPAVDTVPLTPRQAAVLALVVEGRSTAAIGSALGYSESTVKQEISRLLRAFGVTDRTQLAERARGRAEQGPA